MGFYVEGRYFPNSLYAFTFAQIQADRMNRPVEVQLADSRAWHATAHPENFRRQHRVKQPPGVLAAAA
jgi:hypothetical protein